MLWNEDMYCENMSCEDVCVFQCKVDWSATMDSAVDWVICVSNRVTRTQRLSLSRAIVLFHSQLRTRLRQASASTLPHCCDDSSNTYYRPQTKFAKVMFLQVCVYPQRGACIAGGVCGGGGGMHGGEGGAWQGAVRGVGGMHGGGHVWWGACMVGGCVAGGVHGRGACVADTTRYCQWAGCTHPTEMHSCLIENNGVAVDLGCNSFSNNSIVFN